MPRKRFTPEGIVQHLRTLDIENPKGTPLQVMAKKIGICFQTLIHWTAEYSGMRLDQEKWTKNLKKKTFI